MISGRVHVGEFTGASAPLAEKSSANAESTAVEMQRLIRQIAGKADAGEKDEQLRARAMRRLNMGLEGDRQVGPRRARGYWYAEIADVPADHMDRAREVAFVLPIEEALDAAEAAERFIRGLHARLAAMAAGGGHGDARRSARSGEHVGVAVGDRAGLAALVPSPRALKILTGADRSSSSRANSSQRRR